jgi:hypothetical protein
MGQKLRLRPVMLVLASLLIHGCATSSVVDCSKGVGQNGCVPGTEQYEEMVRKKQEAESVAVVDDIRCQAFGARGTPGYAACRRRATEDSEFLNSSH